MAQHYLLTIDERGAPEVTPMLTLPVHSSVLAGAMGALTRQELRTLRCVAAGLTYQETGQEMGLAISTIRDNMVRAAHKIGAPNGGTAATWLLLSGMVGADDVLALWRRWRPALLAQD